MDLRVAVAIFPVIAGTACRDDPAPTSAAPSSTATALASGISEVEAAAQRLCDGGDDRSCDKLMEMYLTGKGAPQSDTRAAELNRRLCEGGRRYFCPSFALALNEGRGIAQDKARARALFAETCDADPVACSEYGSLYANGLGVARDLELARVLLELACRHGDPQACQDLQPR